MTPRCCGAMGDAAGARARRAGFTLVELVIAVAILGATVISLLYLRVAALDRVAVAHHQRYLQRIAQQKLDEVMFGIEEALEGTLETDPRVQWRIEGQEIGSTTPPTETDATEVYIEPQRLIECQVTITFLVPGREGVGEDEGATPDEYRLTSWIYPPPGSFLTQQLGLGADEEYPR